MKIELIEEECLILNELCFNRLLEMGKYHHNKFIDQKQVESYENKLRMLSDKLLQEG